MIAEILDAERKPVLKNVVLRTGGTIDMPPLPVIPVKPDPSPTKRPYTVPAEIVEKNPWLVDIRVVDIFRAIILAAVIVPVLNDVAITSPMFMNPLSLPIVRLSTVSDDI